MATSRQTRKKTVNTTEKNQKTVRVKKKKTVAPKGRHEEQPSVSQPGINFPLKSVESPVAAVPGDRPEKSEGKKVGFIVAAVLIGIIGLVVFEMTYILKTQSAQQRIFRKIGDFGMRGGDVTNPQTYKGVLIQKLDSQERLYLVDSTLNRILVYDTKSKKYLLTIDKNTVGKENFRPYDVDATPDGNIYIVDGLNMEIICVSAGGKLLRRWPVAQSNSLCVDPDGNIVTIDRARFQVVRYSPEGEELLRFGNREKIPNVYRLDTDARGNVYLLDLTKQSIIVYSKKGKYLYSWRLKFKPDAISAVYVKNKIVYINDFNGGLVWAYTVKGKLLWRIRKEWPVAPVSSDENIFYLPTNQGIGYFSLDKY